LTAPHSRSGAALRFPRAAPLAAALLLAGATASAQKFRPDDPLLRDPDDLPMPKPAAIELSTTFDVLEHSFGGGPGGEIPGAVNVNTLGEVPDSTWFTNRPAMTVEEMVRGPEVEGGPDTTQPWTVIAGKSGGITPGFTIRDARGRVYFVKFDPSAFPRLSSAADVISTRFFHDFGYHVPENHIAHFRRGDLRIAPDARVAVRGGKRRPMTESDLDAILADVLRRPDGTMRCVASLRLPGEPIGPRKFSGTRPDDANDVFPHQHRRELRGLRVFSAWLNHDDSRSLNSLDMFVRQEGDRGHVRHYLIDFSSTLGSGSDALRRIRPQNPRAGNEYIIDWGPILKSALTLGLWERPWRDVRYPDYPEVGRFESDFFGPERWRPEYPNPAFQRMLPEDAFWATRIVARFTDQAVRGIVATGQLEDPEAERYLGDTIIERRDKIVAHYFRGVNPLAGFRLEGAGDRRLVFDNLGETAGLASADGYEHQWFAFDNTTGRLEPLAAPAVAETAAVALPSARPEYLMVRLRTLSAAEPAWRKAVDVYVRTAGDGTVVGVEREN
jgi:hypothetical protein